MKNVNIYVPVGGYPDVDALFEATERLSDALVALGADHIGSGTFFGDRPVRDMQFYVPDEAIVAAVTAIASSALIGLSYTVEDAEDDDDADQAVV